jgi:histidinol dehydrogenase
MVPAGSALSEDVRRAIERAAKNIEAFHTAQSSTGERVETDLGVECWRKIVPIQHVGLYVPGGTAPLFSTVLMLSIPARIAGCPSIVLCTPPAKDGSVNPAILYAAKVGGVDAVFKVGGAQAIAAMAYGTATVPKVDKIFGPGNRYVTCAKQQ